MRTLNYDDGYEIPDGQVTRLRIYSVHTAGITEWWLDGTDHTGVNYSDTVWQCHSFEEAWANVKQMASIFPNLGAGVFQ